MESSTCRVLIGAKNETTGFGIAPALTELLPRAFVRSSRMSTYVDRKGGWLVLDTSSRKSAENALTQVREALEKLGGRISADDMRRMNYAADAEHRVVKAIVADFLKSAPTHTPH